MALNPAVQKKAQAEVDRVIPAGRLPTLADFDDLPYTMAVIKETLRWRPAAPLCKLDSCINSGSCTEV
jgi:cytochrome P450